METGTVDYVCSAAEHRPRTAPGRGGLTVNAGKWAFCPAGETAGHIWSPVDGASLDELVRAALAAARTSEPATGSV